MASTPTSTGASTANRQFILAILAIPILLVVAAVAIYLIVSSLSAPSQDSIAQAGLSYGQQQMIWISGPTVQSTHTLQLKDIGPALAAYVPTRVARDINISDLIHRFGANRQVGLVVLSGVFNSLPPDEGVVEHSQVVVLVDVQQVRGFYIND